MMVHKSQGLKGGFKYYRPPTMNTKASYIPSQTKLSQSENTIAFRGRGVESVCQNELPKTHTKNSNISNCIGKICGVRFEAHGLSNPLWLLDPYGVKH